MYRESVRKTEMELDVMLSNQITDSDESDLGGVRSLDTWDINFHDTAALYVWGVRLYLLKDSVYYGKEELYKRISLAYGYCMSHIHENGTKDYIDCDFFTPAGSEVQNLGKTLHILKNLGEHEKKEELREKTFQLMKALTEGILNGGFQTPNHRWIFSGALAVAYSLNPDPRYLSKIEQYLNEGIDCDEDGEYAERSAGIYSYVTNEGLMLSARYLNRPEIYDYVRRNLSMLRYYMEPDGSIFTMNSTRQDKGRTIWAEKYFFEYLYIGTFFQDEKLKKIADRLYNIAKNSERGVPTNLEFLLLNPEFRSYQPETWTEEVEGRLEAYFKNANIVRMVENDISFTLIPESKTFFFAKFGDISLYMRMSAHFFKVRNIIPDVIEKHPFGYRLKFAAEGKFLLPFQEKPETSDWWKMDHSKREIYKPVELKVEIDAIPIEKGIKFVLRTKTYENVPFRVEIGISPNCHISGDGFMCKAQPGMWLIPTKGYLTAQTNRYGIEIGELFGEHGKVEGREGSLPRSKTHMTIYMNGFCRQQERTFHIKEIKHIKQEV